MKKTLFYHSYQENGLKFLDDVASYLKIPLNQPVIETSEDSYQGIQTSFLKNEYVISIFNGKPKPVVLILEIPFIKTLTQLAFGGKLETSFTASPLSISEEFITEWISKKSAALFDSFYPLSFKRFESSIEAVHSFRTEEKIVLNSLRLTIKKQPIGSMLFLESREIDPKYVE
jgi:hypothetical protein